MSWVTVICSMIASACLTLAMMHLFVWCKQRAAWANLLFSLMAAATAAVAGFELWLMRAETPREFGVLLRWGHVPFWVLILSLVGFMQLYLRAGRLWQAKIVRGEAANCAGYFRKTDSGADVLAAIHRVISRKDSGPEAGDVTNPA